MTNRDPWFDVWTTRIRGECDGAGALLTSDKVTELLHNIRGVHLHRALCPLSGDFFLWIWVPLRSPFLSQGPLFLHFRQKCAQKPVLCSKPGPLLAPLFEYFGASSKIGTGIEGSYQDWARGGAQYFGQ